MFDLVQLFSPDFYFQMSPGGEFPLGYLLVFFFGIQLFLRFILSKFGPKNRHFRKAWKKKLIPFDYIAPIGLFLVMFRFAGLPSFSMRIWLVLLLILNIYCLIVAAKNIWRDYYERIGILERRKRRKYA